MKCHAKDEVPCALLQNATKEATPFEQDPMCNPEFSAVSGIRPDCKCMDGYIKDGAEATQKLGVNFGTRMCFKAGSCGCYDALTNKRVQVCDKNIEIHY